MSTHQSLIATASLILCMVTIGTSSFSCHAFSQRSMRPYAARARYSIPSSTRSSHIISYLFQKTPVEIAGSTSGISQDALNSRIPATELSILNKGFGVGNTPPFPYTINLLPKKTEDETMSNRATKMVIRHLEEEDIICILPEVVREFGSLMSQTNSNKQPGDEVATQIENYLFSMTVLIGLTQRVKRRIKGYPEGTGSNYPDHNVICIVEQIPIISQDASQPETYNEQIVGIGEISWQPPNPNRNAPPFVLPYFIKQILSKFSSGVGIDGEVLDAPRGYISNVLVYKNRRGLGYGRVLMAALEGIAKTWDCKDVRLHVDADEKSGKVAQALYRKLGYIGVPDRGSSAKKSKDEKLGYEWMGPSMASEGLYMVDGIPLLYMQKSL